MSRRHVATRSIVSGPGAPASLPTGPVRGGARRATTRCRWRRGRSDRSPGTPSSPTRPLQATRLGHAPQRGRPGSHRRRQASPPDHGSRGRGMAASAPLGPRKPGRQRPCQPGLVSDLGRHGAARVRHHPLSVRRHIYLHPAPIARDLQGDPPELVLEPSTSRRIPARADSQAAPTAKAATVSRTSRTIRADWARSEPPRPDRIS
jgi:hypothetical protein